METTDGWDLCPLLETGAQPGLEERPSITEFPLSKSIRFGPWRMVQTHRRLHGGADVGELYHLENDPLEQKNLYHDPDCRGVVEDLRRRLLEWMCETRQVRSAWPPLPDETGSRREDGYESTGGLWRRLEQGNWNTFEPRDYL